MKRKTLNQLARDPRFIPGIYNYCDRWCERCPFSNRCLNFAMEKEKDDGDPEARDLTNKKFWKKLETRFATRSKWSARTRKKWKSISMIRTCRRKSRHRSDWSDAARRRIVR